MQKLKFILPLFFLVASAAFAQHFPEKPNPPRLVNDFANILSGSEQQHLEQKLLRYNDTTSTEIAVITVNSLDGDDINLYAAELGQKWGIGRKGKDNGVVFLVAPNERKVAIQNGYGLEDVLTDAYTKIIIEDYVLPSFKKGNYYEGIDRGTDQIINLLAGKFKGKPNRRSSQKKGWHFIPIIIILIVIFSVFRRRGGRGGGYRGGGGYWIGGFGGGLGGGSSFGGGGGGGFGGFGGGGFGGGGASGSW